MQLYHYFVSQSSEFCHPNPLCCFSMNFYCCKRIFRYWLSPETFGYTLVHASQCWEKRKCYKTSEIYTNCSQVCRNRTVRCNIPNVRTILSDCKQIHISITCLRSSVCCHHSILCPHKWLLYELVYSMWATCPAYHYVTNLTLLDELYAYTTKFSLCDFVHSPFHLSQVQTFFSLLCSLIRVRKYQLQVSNKYYNL